MSRPLVFAGCYYRHWARRAADPGPARAVCNPHECGCPILCGTAQPRVYPYGMERMVDWLRRLARARGGRP